MNDINVIKPVKENEKKGAWNKIKEITAIVATLAVMTTVGCSSKSEIEWTGDKDKLQNDELVQDGDEEEDVKKDEEGDELLSDEDIIEIDEEQDEIEDEDIIDVEVDDEILVDEDIVEIDEEQDLDTVPDEDTVVEVPETIVTLELNVDENVIRVTAGEEIEINGMKYKVKYDNNDGNIYLMNNEELIGIEWNQNNIANGAEVSVKDIWVNKTAFDTRILYKVTDVNTDQVWHTISNEKGVSIAVNTENGNLEYVFLDTLQNEDWDSGSRTIISFEANVGGVETKVEDFMVTDTGKHVGNYFIEPTYSVNLYNGKNVILAIEINCGEETIIYAMEEKVIKNIDVCGNIIEFSVENTFFDEVNFKGWANVFVDSELVRTFEQDKPEYYHENVKFELKEVSFIE